ncbi:30S ribosomal protein S18 [Linum grandiflorum]
MRALAPLLRSAANNGFIRRPEPSLAAKSLSTNAQSVASNSFERDDFERRIFGDVPDGGDSNSFFRNLGKAQKARFQFSSGTRGAGGGGGVGGDGSDTGEDGHSNTLDDGMDQKLKKTAAFFKFDSYETVKPDSGFRPDKSFFPTANNNFKDLRFRNQRMQRPPPRHELKVTTAEVLKKADFRNVRFLANFLTEAGIIVKRSKTGISAKAQRKIAREIKTARSFGLLPFTTMGTKPFHFGQNMEDRDGY